MFILIIRIYCLRFALFKSVRLIYWLAWINSHLNLSRLFTVQLSMFAGKLVCLVAFRRCSATFISYHTFKSLSTTFLFFFWTFSKFFVVTRSRQLVYIIRCSLTCQQLFSFFCEAEWLIQIPITITFNDHRSLSPAVELHIITICKNCQQLF